MEGWRDGDVMCKTAVKLLDVGLKLDQTGEKTILTCLVRMCVREMNHLLSDCKDDVISVKGINAKHHFHLITPL